MDPNYVETDEEMAEAEVAYEQHLAEREHAHESYLDSLVGGNY